MKKLFVAATLAATALTGTVAAAQSAPAAAARPLPAAAMLDADANKDGVVTRAEAGAAADARFAAIDTDRDGKITREERRTTRPARHPGAGADGKITRAEALARAAARFDAADANHDGTLTADERPARGAHAGGKQGERRLHGPRGDRRDSEVTQAQFRDGALRLFDRADANHDGRVTAQERDAMRLVMRARMAERADR